MSEEKLQQHLAHPFYHKSKVFWLDVQKRQINKGLEKYGKVFTPSDWSGEELFGHVMEEMVDATHYLVGMKERMEEQQRTIDELHNEIINQRVVIQGLYERLRKYEG